MTDKRPLAVLLVVLAMLGGGYFFTHRGDNPAPTTSSSTSTTQDTATTAAPETGGSTTVATAADGLPVASGSAVDWQTGLARITDMENELFTAPDASRVSEIMLPECACYKSTIDRLNALKAKNQHVAGANIILTETQFVNQVSNTRVEIFTQPKAGNFPTVDANGNTVSPPPTGGKVPFLYVLDKGSDGIWRLADRHLIGSEQ